MAVDSLKPFLVRIELAFLDWLIDNGGSAFDELRDAGKILSAHQAGDEPEFPYLAVYAGTTQEFSDMPRKTQVWEIDLTWHLKVAAKDADGEAGCDSEGDPGNYPASRDDTDPIFAELDRILNEEKDEIITALNIPHGEDTRTYGRIHIYDILPGEQVSVGDEAQFWTEQNTWTVIAQSANGNDPGPGS